MKRKSIRLMVGIIAIVFSLIVVNQHVFADEAQYDSNAGVGFYGKYEEDKTITKPTEPEKTIDLDKPKTNVTIPTTETPISQKPVGRLPGLGDANHNNQLNLFIGISILSLVGLIYYKKEWKNNEQIC